MKNNWGGGFTRDHKVEHASLKGTVADRESKRRGKDIVESCFGVKDVQNQLRVQRQDLGEFRFRFS